jgi:hypothetical protein
MSRPPRPSEKLDETDGEAPVDAGAETLERDGEVVDPAAIGAAPTQSPDDPDALHPFGRDPSMIPAAVPAPGDSIDDEGYDDPSTSILTHVEDIRDGDESLSGADLQEILSAVPTMVGELSAIPNAQSQVDEFFENWDFFLRHFRSRLEGKPVNGIQLAFTLSEAINFNNPGAPAFFDVLLAEIDTAVHFRREARQIPTDEGRIARAASQSKVQHNYTIFTNAPIKGASNESILVSRAVFTSDALAITTAIGRELPPPTAVTARAEALAAELTPALKRASWRSLVTHRTAMLDLMRHMTTQATPLEKLELFVEVINVHLMTRVDHEAKTHELINPEIEDLARFSQDVERALNTLNPNHEVIRAFMGEVVVIMTEPSTTPEEKMRLVGPLPARYASQFNGAPEEDIMATSRALELALGALDLDADPLDDIMALIIDQGAEPILDPDVEQTPEKPTYYSGGIAFDKALKVDIPCPDGTGRPLLSALAWLHFVHGEEHPGGLTELNCSDVMTRLGKDLRIAMAASEGPAADLMYTLSLSFLGTAVDAVEGLDLEDYRVATIRLLTPFFRALFPNNKDCRWTKDLATFLGEPAVETAAPEAAPAPVGALTSEVDDLSPSYDPFEIDVAPDAEPIADQPDPDASSSAPGAIPPRISSTTLAELSVQRLTGDMAALDAPHLRPQPPVAPEEGPELRVPVTHIIETIIPRYTAGELMIYPCSDGIERSLIGLICYERRAGLLRANDFYNVMTELGSRIETLLDDPRNHTTKEGLIMNLDIECRRLIDMQGFSRDEILQILEHLPYGIGSDIAQQLFSEEAPLEASAAVADDLNLDFDALGADLPAPSVDNQGVGGLAAALREVADGSAVFDEASRRDAEAREAAEAVEGPLLQEFTLRGAPHPLASAVAISELDDGTQVIELVHPLINPLGANVPTELTSDRASAIYRELTALPLNEIAVQGSLPTEFTFRDEYSHYCSDEVIRPHLEAMVFEHLQSGEVELEELSNLVSAYAELHHEYIDALGFAQDEGKRQAVQGRILEAQLQSIYLEYVVNGAENGHPMTEDFFKMVILSLFVGIGDELDRAFNVVAGHTSSADAQAAHERAVAIAEIEELDLAEMETALATAPPEPASPPPVPGAASGASSDDAVLDEEARVASSKATAARETGPIPLADIARGLFSSSPPAAAPVVDEWSFTPDPLAAPTAGSGEWALKAPASIGLTPPDAAPGPDELGPVSAPTEAGSSLDDPFDGPTGPGLEGTPRIPDLFERSAEVTRIHTAIVDGFGDEAELANVRALIKTEENPDGEIEPRDVLSGLHFLLLEAEGDEEAQARYQRIIDALLPRPKSRWKRPAAISFVVSTTLIAAALVYALVQRPAAPTADPNAKKPKVTAGGGAPAPAPRPKPAPSVAPDAAPEPAPSAAPQAYPGIDTKEVAESLGRYRGTKDGIIKYMPTKEKLATQGFTDIEKVSGGFQARQGDVLYEIPRIIRVEVPVPQK